MQRPAEPIQGGLYPIQQLLTQQQILRWIAGERQLREQNGVGALLIPGNLGRFHHPLRIASHITHQEIELGQGDFQVQDFTLINP